ncbi:zinc finger protein RP-8 [Rhynchophorus ferrugineus]|uniref:zinc finger protein RP-8 n=1 Tax=Rhynchophorus ferrugineus TaxID=354439 RepID=UPI003FCD8C2E
MPSVELGFLEECESWKLESRMFPSKVGGKPAWLSLKTLPSAEQLKCNKCNCTMVFLCQIYAPYEDCDENTDIWINNFHRTVYVFICRNSNCNDRNTTENIAVFRNNIPRMNDFYSYDPPEEKPDTTFDVRKFTSLCNACGISAEKRCSKCKIVFYCTREHQVIDWKNGHKEICLNQSELNNAETLSQILFSEWELITETERIENEEFDEAKELQKFEELKIQGKTGTLENISEYELNNHASSEKDKVFLKFKKQISYYPEQVVRYSRGGNPLLIAKEPLPTSIPDCELCGGHRQFEFQIMPQMLSELKEQNLDFGVILIYTCTSSCVGNSVNSYKKEFAFRQDVSLSDN